MQVMAPCGAPPFSGCGGVMGKALGASLGSATSVLELWLREEIRATTQIIMESLFRKPWGKRKWAVEDTGLENEAQQRKGLWSFGGWGAQGERQGAG